MGQAIKVRYTGELGYFATIEQVFNWFKFIDWNIDGFRKFKDPQTGLRNIDVIWDSYEVVTMIYAGFFNEDGSPNPNKKPDDVENHYPCPVPIEFCVDSKYLQKSLIITQSNLLTDNFAVTDFPGGTSFMLDSNTFYDDWNERTISKRRLDGNVKADNCSKSRVQPHVFIWCKALIDNGKFNERSVFDLSPFLLNLNMTVAQTGGNFSLQLAPIEGLITCGIDGEVNGIWNFDKSQHISFDPISEDPQISKEHYFKTLITKLYSVWVISNSNSKVRQYYRGKGRDETDPLGGFGLNDVDEKSPYKDNDNNPQLDSVRIDNVRQWTKMFFENIISPNDIVFISYENPVMKDSNFSDGEASIEYIDDFFVNPSSLFFCNFDMIGLVDTNSISHTAENEDVSINVSGRDCMKLLIEDGSYFFAKSFSNPDESSTAFNNVDLPNQGDGVNSFNNSTQSPKSVNRLITTGMLDMLFIPEARNVNFVMNLLMSKLSNIEICPSDLFKTWGASRTRFSIVTEEQVEQTMENQIGLDAAIGD